jgi:colanic acid/amylovoran biosynthesis glycosyltransferase
MTRLAYLVNQYPLSSHTFIRREIAALASLGITVRRFSIRPTREALVDPDDERELRVTRPLLARGVPGLIGGLLWAAATRPARFAKALRLSLRLGRRSERGVILHLAYLAEACVLAGWLAEDPADHLHSHFGTNSATVSMLCHELGGPPYSFTVHGPEEFDRATVLGLDEKIARAKFVAAVSAFGRGQLLRWCDARHWSKIQVVRCGLDGDFLDHDETPIPSDPRLVCVGRLCEQKGQLLLVEAVAGLAAEGIEVRVVLVGDGEMRPQIESAIERHGLCRAVTITGWVSNKEVRRQLLSSRALCLPSLAEGLPVVIMEAFALRRPVISTRVAGIPELVEAGVSGWLVTAGSIDELSQAIREAIQSPVRRLDQMGAAGAEKVRQNHDARVNARRLSHLISSSDRGGSPAIRPRKIPNPKGALGTTP